MPEAEVVALNGLLLVVGGRRAEVPASIADGIVAATPTCVAVGTRHPVDGPVTVSLATIGSRESGALLFDGLLDTPDLEVRVEDVNAVEYLKLSVGADRVRVRVFTDDVSEPGVVAIRIS